MGMSRRRMMGVVGSVAAGASGLTLGSADGAEATTETRSLFLFQYRLGPNWRADASLREQLGPHAAYMSELATQQRLVVAGPYLEANGGGMAVVLAADLAEARTMLEADPAIVSGVFEADLRAWAIRFHGAPMPI